MQILSGSMRYLKSRPNPEIDKKIRMLGFVNFVLKLILKNEIRNYVLDLYDH